MKIKRLMVLTVSVMCLAACNNTDVGIIGGSDGPTSAYIREQDGGELKEEKSKIVEKKTLTPTGFSGSSLNRIALYSNGDVYWIQYDGAGFEKENIVKNELIVRNAEDIEMWEEEGIVVVGEDLKPVEELNIGWLKIDK